MTLEIHLWISRAPLYDEKIIPFRFYLKVKIACTYKLHLFLHLYRTNSTLFWNNSLKEVHTLVCAITVLIVPLNHWKERGQLAMKRQWKILITGSSLDSIAMLPFQGPMYWLKILINLDTNRFCPGPIWIDFKKHYKLTW